VPKGCAFSAKVKWELREADTHLGQRPCSRANRPDTNPQPTGQFRFKSALDPWGRSLIAASLSRASFTSPARVMVLFAVSAGCRNIWSGPEDRHCKVHNGLTLITRPSPRRAIACTLALGRCVLAYLTSVDELRCHGRRGPAEWHARSPDTVQDYRQLARQGYSCLA
jgi:hypothetical protein